MKRPPIQADGTQEIRAEDVLEALDAAPAFAPRAAACANATQEIRAEDVLEALDAAPPVDIPIDEEPPLERLAAPRSIAPVAIEIPGPAPSSAPRFVPRAGLSGPTLLAEITSQLQAWKPPRKFRTIVEVVMALSLVILAAAGVRAHFAAQEPDELPSALAAAPTAPAAQPAAPRAPTALAAPSVDVRALPSAPTTGTIELGPGARGLTVDNAKISTSSAVVPCGGHVLRVGKEKPRKVDVPCGATLVASPHGTFTVK